jgi:hypothetical protein
MFERISNGMELARESWRVLKQDRELLVFPLLSGLASAMVLASFAVPLWGTQYARQLLDEKQLPADPWAYAILLAFYFVNYFVIVYFNSALVACAIIRLRGGDPTVADGIRAANARLPHILAWALVSATVGLLLKAIESRSEKAGQIAVGLVGAAWSIATYFVVPVLVVEQVGPLDAIQRSFSILRKTWGESIVGNFGIGLVVFGATLIALLPAAIGVATGAAAGITLGVVITVVLLVLISLVSTALHTIIQAALYLFAADGQAPRQFDARLLQEAYRPK